MAKADDQGNLCVVIAGSSGAPANIQGNVASGATDSGNPVKVGGVYNSTPPTLTNGQRGDLQLDSSGNVKEYLATQLDSTNDSISTYEKGFTYTNLTASGQVSGQSCVFAGFTCTASTSGTVTVYDNTTNSGTVVAFSAASVSANTQYILSKPITLTTGCYIVIGGTATIQVLTRAIGK